MHWAADGHDTPQRPAFALSPALDGSGACVGVQAFPDPVSSRPCSCPEVSVYEPAATHWDADEQDTPSVPAFPLVSALAGRGASAAVHELPEPVSSRPWPC